MQHIRCEHTRSSSSSSSLGLFEDGVDPDSKCVGEDGGGGEEEYDDEADSLSTRRSEVVIFRERWAEKQARIQATSPYGHLQGWRLLPVIVKANDDLRQEQVAMQLLQRFKAVFAAADLPLFVRTYDIIATGPSSGLIEAIPDTVSLHALKKNDPDFTTLSDFFIRFFGPRNSPPHRRAVRRFVSSLAAYSIICYLLQIKDRHNGNILLDCQGHLVHIDFGFLLSNSPGSNANFEKAPFKLTTEPVDVMGGARSSSFRQFRSLCVRGFMAARKEREKIILLMEMMVKGNEDLPCFSGRPEAAVKQLRSRFQPHMRAAACHEFVHGLIDDSLNNWRTRWYDKYQRLWVGVL